MIKEVNYQQNSYRTVIRVHLTMHLMHPNYCQITIMCVCLCMYICLCVCTSHCVCVCVWLCTYSAASIFECVDVSVFAIIPMNNLLHC